MFGNKKDKKKKEIRFSKPMMCKVTEIQHGKFNFIMRKLNKTTGGTMRDIIQDYINDYEKKNGIIQTSQLTLFK